MKKILVVEDDPAVQRALKRLFEAEEFAVEIKSDGKSGLEAFRTAAPSAVILDLRLPEMSGSEVCREIKKKAPALPVIVLSAKSDVTDKVLLLELGADDYVTKPFSPRELLARLQAALRRTARAEVGDIFTFGNISVDFAKMEIVRNGQAVAIAPTAARAPEATMRKSRRVGSPWTPAGMLEEAIACYHPPRS